MPAIKKANNPALTGKPGELLFSKARIQKRIRELAAELEPVCRRDKVVFLGLMNGALFFLADLLRYLPHDSIVHCGTIHSYSGTESTGVIRGLDALEADCYRGKHVILVDDILDTGRTLHAVAQRIRELGAKKVSSCVLCSKQVVRTKKIEATWVGFEVPPKFVVGYGLDFDGLYRNREDIRVLEFPPGVTEP